ncbi:helicase associated domain-containing protein [Niveomyces insectorum RCEF 264]|uniref:RNA helicase n=1 Tax=Niveomyces insectorum RCEF 264 TaxID=1081102 RepID=A0A168A9X9_9HYPO|nr:helicase associated domain-containing protein [Niveomyces insectorum RCEF 264]
MTTERKAKRRKTEDGPDSSSSIKIGGKVISLGGYLNAPSVKKQSQKSPQDEKKPLEKDNGDAQQPPSETQNGQANGKPRRERDEAIRGDPSLFAARKALPIWESRHEIRQSLRVSDVLILVGETGSGKSTQVPQFLCDEPWCTGLVAITQPRRVAATTLAYRVAREMGTPLNGRGDDSDALTGRVGYSVRFDHKVPRGTKVKFLTEGMLLQEMLRDPALRQYSAVVVDEVHERSVDVDLLLGFLRQLLEASQSGTLGGSSSSSGPSADKADRQPPQKRQRNGRPLKVVVMSATADVEKIRGFFTSNTDANVTIKERPTPTAVQRAASPLSQVRVLKIPGRQYPVKVIHTPKPVPDVLEALVKIVFQLHIGEPLPGDILVFLTGQEEIDAAKRLIEERAATLASNMPHIEICPLFGQLSIEAQYKAFQPASRPFTRKVVLATNIAETSVTVPGVRYVVDGGKAKVKQFRARLGLESLLAKPIAQTSAIQRAGRAGREGPGKCFRLYTEEAYEQFAAVDLPEILRIDILGAVLTMKARGIDDVFTFPLMDAPDAESLERALVHLHHLGALADDGAITDEGRTMSLLPVSAPYGRVLLAAAAADCVLEAIDIIACLTAGDDIFQPLQSDNDRDEVEAYRKELQRREGDLLTYLTAVQRMTAEPSRQWKTWCQQRRINLRNMRQALNIRRQLRSLCIREKLLAADAVPDNSAEAREFAPLPPDRADVLLRCFLRGFALKTALLAPDGSYVTTHGKHVVAIHPSSVLHGRKTEAIMFLEHVFTLKNYARKVSTIQANWIAEALAPH